MESGAKHTVSVTATTKCVEFGTGKTTCHLDYAYKGGSEICTTGDSGGPVYQRATGGAKARGIIIGVSTTEVCFFQEITPTLSEVNGTILGT